MYFLGGELRPNHSGDAMNRFILSALLLLGFAGSGWAQSWVYTPPTSSPGVGTVTSITAGQGIDLDGTCGSGSTTTTGTLTACANQNAQTGTTYTVLSSDCGKQVTLSNASAVAVTLPQAGTGGFNAGCIIGFTNLGAGTVTITPTTSTIDGLSSRALQQYGGVVVISNGTNYISRGVAPAVGANGIIDQDQIPTATTTVKGGVKASTCLSMSGTQMSVDSLCRRMVIVYPIGTGAAVVSTGIQPGDILIPFGCTITSASLRLNQTGSMVVDIWALAYSTSAAPTVANTITASAKPTVSSALASSVDTTLTGWTTSISGSLSTPTVLRVNVDSVSTATYATLTLTCLRTGS